MGRKNKVRAGERMNGADGRKDGRIWTHTHTYTSGRLESYSGALPHPLYATLPSVKTVVTFTTQPQSGRINKMLNRTWMCLTRMIPSLYTECQNSQQI